MLDWEPPPCTWPLDTMQCPGWPESPTLWTPKHRLAAEFATEVLWERTSRRYGLYLERIVPGGVKPLREVELLGPVHTVIEVQEDGRALPADEYRLRSRPGGTDAKGLVRRDGRAWPPDTTSVLYLRGWAIPWLGQRALCALASEIYKRSTDDSSPRTALRLDGTVYDMWFPGDWRDGGETGLPEVDTFLRRATTDG